MKLKDGDYVLSEGAAWIEVGKYAIRIRTTQKGDGIGIEVFQNGKEFDDPVDQCWVFDSDLGE